MIIEEGLKYVNRNGDIRQVVRMAPPSGGYWTTYTAGGAVVGVCNACGQLSRFSSSPDDLVDVYFDDSLPAEVEKAIQNVAAATRQLEQEVHNYLTSCWAVAPAWAKWLAMDSNHNWFWFEYQPYPDSVAFCLSDKGGKHKRSGCAYKALDWKRSLCERPFANS